MHMYYSLLAAGRAGRTCEARLELSTGRPAYTCDVIVRARASNPGDTVYKVNQ